MQVQHGFGHCGQGQRTSPQSPVLNPQSAVNPPCACGLQEKPTRLFFYLQNKAISLARGFGARCLVQCLSDTAQLAVHPSAASRPVFGIQSACRAAVLTLHDVLLVRPGHRVRRNPPQVASCGRTRSPQRRTRQASQPTPLAIRHGPLPKGCLVPARRRGGRRGMQRQGLGDRCPRSAALCHSALLCVSPCLRWTTGYALAKILLPTPGGECAWQGARRAVQ